MSTAFQEAVWAKLAEIPRGKVTTYKEVAQAVGSPQAVRAVGSACAANPTLVEVPCHRVVQSNGDVGGYARGRLAKINLLKQEGVTVTPDGKVDYLEQYLYRFHPR